MGVKCVNWSHESRDFMLFWLVCCRRTSLARLPTIRLIWWNFYWAANRQKDLHNFWHFSNIVWAHQGHVMNTSVQTQSESQSIWHFTSYKRNNKKHALNSAQNGLFGEALSTEAFHRWEAFWSSFLLEEMFSKHTIVFYSEKLIKKQTNTQINSNNQFCCLLRYIGPTR